ncbi:hypothetical protein T492DRAFT_1117292 [Pavlovales sp. CCMP2436]|nr:hypothetical protein T492DRAFT_1117292 [Pavlovales sp. CCMP2436]
MPAAALRSAFLCLSLGLAHAAWTLGDNNLKCDDICIRLRSCNVAQLTSINDAAKVNATMASVGIVCASFLGVGGGKMPAVKTSNDECRFNTGTTSCSGSTNGERRLCFCNSYPSPPPSPPLPPSSPLQTATYDQATICSDTVYNWRLEGSVEEAIVGHGTTLRSTAPGNLPASPTYTADGYSSPGPSISRWTRSLTSAEWGLHRSCRRGSSRYPSPTGRTS